MLINPSHPIIDRTSPDDCSVVSRMFADWCAKQGARTEIEYEDGVKYVHAYLGERCDRMVTAAFDAFDGRFMRDGSVATECELGSTTTLKELANALRTGHRRGGHRR
jgi:hypothetical protein